VRISGGGRCNVTHNCTDIESLLKNYPRGSKELRQVFSRFAVTDTIEWFTRNGVKLKTEGDGRMFPVTDSSQTIIDCLLDLAKKHNIKIRTGCEVFSIHKKEDGFELKTTAGLIHCQFVVCAIGGHPKKGTYDLVANLGHTIVTPIPSLFTFNMPSEKIRKELQGVVAPEAEVSVQGTKLKYRGPVLITHWGLSGPAVLKLSAFAAELFYEKNYDGEIKVNWTGKSLEENSELIKNLKEQKARSFPRNTNPEGIPSRLWNFFCDEAGLGSTTTWAETGKKEIIKLVELVYSGRYKMEGKTTFKEEFVTCGGVHLKQVDFRTMESRIVSGLYFCGEALNIDAITGGFNFQAAWSTAFVCASAIHTKSSHNS
jgi:predicted Rossmann fold flavoprotein